MEKYLDVYLEKFKNLIRLASATNNFEIDIITDNYISIKNCVSANLPLSEILEIFTVLKE